MLPHGMKSKTQHKPHKAMKRLHWTVINPHCMDKDSVWVSFDCSIEEKLNLDRLAKAFSSKPAKKTECQQSVTKRKGKELLFLDTKTAQNISIFLRSVNLNLSNLKNHILEMDEDDLTVELVQNLLKHVPQDDDTMNKVVDFAADFETLTEPEKLLVTLASVFRIVPRLKLMEFKMRFSDLLKQTDRNLQAVTASLTEIRGCVGLHKVLEIILCMGNYLNSGTAKAQSHGFHLDYLPKLRNTTTADGKRTFLHCLYETLEEVSPKLCVFHDELRELRLASHVSLDQTSQTLTHVAQMLRNCAVEAQLSAASPRTEPNDKFVPVMHDFHSHAKKQVESREQRFQTVSVLYEAVCKLFSFQQKQYPVEQFFQDLCTFVDHFKKAKHEIAKQREIEMKREKARLAKEQAEKERRKKKLAAEKEKPNKCSSNESTILDLIREKFKIPMKRNSRKSSRKISTSDFVVP